MERILGVDVSKDYLDTDTLPPTQQRRFTNDPAGTAELVEWARGFRPDRIVFESTGPYQKAAVGALLAAALPAVVVNARQVRDFAKALGILAKTDTIDAAVLARFGQVVPTIVRPLPTPEIQAFQELYDRRGQLVRMLAAEKNHRYAATSAKVIKNIDAHIRYLENQIETLEDRMDQFVQNSEAFKARDEILQSIPGVGPQVSRTLLAYLPELGQGTRQQLSALVGLAPFNDDSGTQSHTRHIRGGQASKVALIAVARKLLVLANALVRSMKPYDPANSVCLPSP